MALNIFNMYIHFFTLQIQNPLPAIMLHIVQLLTVQKQEQLLCVQINVVSKFYYSHFHFLIGFFNLYLNFSIFTHCKYKFFQNDVQISKSVLKLGETRTAMPSEHVLASSNIEVARIMKRNVV